MRYCIPCLDMFGRLPARSDPGRWEDRVSQDSGPVRKLQPWAFASCQSVAAARLKPQRMRLFSGWTRWHTHALKLLKAPSGLPVSCHVGQVVQLPAHDFSLSTVVIGRVVNGTILLFYQESMDKLSDVKKSLQILSASITWWNPAVNLPLRRRFDPFLIDL